MRASVWVSFAALVLANPVTTSAVTPAVDHYLALAACPDRAVQAGDVPTWELSQSVMDKESTDEALDRLKEYLEFHDQAQAATGARAALMPWSDLAIHAN